jgi:molybdate-binding protein
MTRYLRLSKELAGRVASGELGPGAELPSLRDLARREGTTVSTVGRAYQHLSDAGLVVIGDRRRARIAAGGAAAARRLLAAPAAFRLAGSDDPALDLLLRHVGAAVTVVGVRGSLHALLALTRDDADGAAIHLRHPDGSYNVGFARAALRGYRPTLVHLWRREQGLLLPAGNPHRISGIADLRGRRVAKRTPGTGTRVLLDRLATAAGLNPDRIDGPELGSHLEVALTIGAGAADTGLALRSAVYGLGLDFHALAWESYDLVLDHERLTAAAPLLSALHNPSIRTEITRLGGYDLDHAGDVTVIPDDSTIAAADPL